MNPILAQNRYRVLFLGNSYTGTNSLPRMTQDLAQSAGDTLVYEIYSPGGYRLIDHLNDSMSRAKIRMGRWDFMVMQGHSQEPILDPAQFTTAAEGLYDLLRQTSPCAVLMPYMTWGRKNGDTTNCAAFPSMCTYQSMDSTLCKRYMELTSSFNGEVSPVSVVWNYLRQHHPGIELYNPDGSHPSLAGTYAAACCFYASIFKKDPTRILANGGLDPADAAIIRTAAKLQVFDRLSEWDFKKAPRAQFKLKIGAGLNEVWLNSDSGGVRQRYAWDFGDGSNSTLFDPVHSFAANGTYTIALTTSTCDYRGTHTCRKDTVVQFCAHTPTVYSIKPWLCRSDSLWTQAADRYRWMANGVLLPDTTRYLPNYLRYGTCSFTVIATVAGCAESSQDYAAAPEPRAYRFAAEGTPCTGDTAVIAVLRNGGSLSGFEQIMWYQNGVLLAAMNNRDTLKVSSGGRYEVVVKDPVSRCPADTASTLVEYNCGVATGIFTPTEAAATLYPNPAYSVVTVRFARPLVRDQVQLFNADGRLVRQQDADRVSVLTVDVSALPKGLYFVRLRSGKAGVAKFVRM